MDADQSGERHDKSLQKEKHIVTYPQHSEEEGDEEEKGTMTHAAPSGHQEKLLLGHLTYGPVLKAMET